MQGRTSRQDCAPNYEETAITQELGIAEDKEERTRFDRTAKKSENKMVKE